jgi:DNA-binding MarR family transcriptional regulator
MSVHPDSRSIDLDLEHGSVAVLQQFGRTYRAYASAFEQRLGIPLARWRVLLALYLHEAAIGQKALADRVAMDPGALTRQLKTMQALGWIQRQTCERDNRVTNVVLSAAGRALVEGLLPSRKAFLEDVLANVTEDTMRDLSASLARLESGIADAVARAASDAPA